MARGPACCEFYFYEIQDLLLSLFLHNLSILFLLVLPNVSSAIGFRWPEWKAIIGMFCQTFLADLDLSSLTNIRIIWCETKIYLFHKKRLLFKTFLFSKQKLDWQCQCPFIKTLLFCILILCSLLFCQ